MNADIDAPPPLATLTDIFMAGVDRVDPERLICRSVTLDGTVMRIDAAGGGETIDLDRFDRVVVLGFGKATARMAKAIEAILGDRIVDGVIAVKYGHTEPLTRIRTIEAGHPVPDENGVRAAAEIAAVAQKADADTLVITLVSGGGSALIPLPFSWKPEGAPPLALSLADKQAVTRSLLACGAVIDEINCLRKHLSQIKGGHLARLIFPARSVNLILSDVVGDRLDTIASGPTTADSTRFADALAIVDKYGLDAKLPDSVRRLFQLGADGRIPDTPDAGDPIFERVTNLLIGTNFLSLEAARERAHQLGCSARILTSQVVGEAREVAKFYCAIGKDALKHRLWGPPPVCLIAGGETTVTLTGGGRGGRNQEMALAFLAEMAQQPETCRGLYFLAASTDGSDGPTDAAGAFACCELLDRARQGGVSITGHLRQNDAYGFFEAVDGLFKTGPTNTNVCDIQLLLIP